MTTALDILRKHFCAAPTDPREYLRDLMQFDGHITATNGHWIGFLDSGATCMTAAPVPDRLQEDFRGHVKAAQEYAGPFIAASDVGIGRLPCPVCSGHGRVIENDCDDCDGEGEFEYGSHWYECKECGGTGSNRSEPTASGGTQCWRCDGTGIRDWPSTHGDRGRGQSASARYIRKLREIGGEISNELVQTFRGQHWFVIRFPGGRGFLLPMSGAPLDPAESDLAPEAAA